MRSLTPVLSKGEGAAKGNYCSNTNLKVLSLWGGFR